MFLATMPCFRRGYAYLPDLRHRWLHPVICQGSERHGHRPHRFPAPGNSALTDASTLSVDKFSSVFWERPTLLLIFKPVVNIGIILLADKLFFVKVHIKIPVIIQKIDFSLIASDYGTKKVLKRMMNLC